MALLQEEKTDITNDQARAILFGTRQLDQK
jgi:hypothetical protein